MMQGTSRTSLADVAERFEPALTSAGSAGALRAGEQLYGVAVLLDSSSALRRAVSDPARSGDDKASLVQRLLSSQVGNLALDAVSSVARERWSAGRDVADALERLGTQALLSSAEADGALDRVEEELFRFARTVDANRALASALGDRTAAAGERAALVDRLIATKAHPVTTALVRQVALAPRGRTIETALADLLDVAAARRRRLVAMVTAAVPLSARQLDRLEAVLSAQYGRTVVVEVAVDPAVVGGLRVTIGGEILEATVATRLDEARRALTR